MGFQIVGGDAQFLIRSCKTFPCRLVEGAVIYAADVSDNSNLYF